MQIILDPKLIFLGSLKILAEFTFFNSPNFLESPSVLFVNFPKNKKPNLKAEAKDKVIAQDLVCINENMKSDKWDITVVPNHIVYTLSTYGEVLELEPIVARRLIANLSTVIMKLRDQLANPFGEEL